MAIRTGINGFGRIGRLLVRALADHPELELVHVNEVKGGVDCAAHLLEFDTVHGRFDGQVSVVEGGLVINGQRVGFSEHETPGAVPWADHGVELVLECSGRFRTMESLAPYFEHGVEKVLIAAVARVLRDRPEDPIGALGSLLCKPKSGFASYANWPPGLPPFVSHAAPALSVKRQ